MIGAGIFPTIPRTPVSPWTTGRSASETPPADPIRSFWKAFPSFFRSPFRLSIRVRAFSAAVPDLEIPADQTSKPFVSLKRTFAARMASDPKIVAIAWLRCCWVSPAILVFNWSCSPAIPMNLPLASKVEMPSASISFCAFFDGDANEDSIVFSDVPASLPFNPAWSNIARVETVSCSVRPKDAATLPPCESPCASEPIDAVDMFAPLASVSAISPMSEALRLNMDMAFAAVSAASPVDTPPAAASASVSGSADMI